MSYLVTQIFLYLCCTFVLGLVLGWLLWGFERPSKATHAAAQHERNEMERLYTRMQKELAEERTAAAQMREQLQELGVTS